MFNFIKEMKTAGKYENGNNKKIDLGNGAFLSIQASEDHYCEPRVSGLELEEYEAFEVAILDEDDKFISRELLGHYSDLFRNENDDVLSMSKYGVEMMYKDIKEKTAKEILLERAICSYKKIEEEKKELEKEQKELKEKREELDRKLIEKKIVLEKIEKLENKPKKNKIKKTIKKVVEKIKNLF